MRIVSNAVECNSVECNSADGKGCGEVWIEWDGEAREFCSRCGRPATDGNVVVNSERCPDVMGLGDRHVLVGWDERVVGRF